MPTATEMNRRLANAMTYRYDTACRHVSAMAMIVDDTKLGSTSCQGNSASDSTTSGASQRNSDAKSIFREKKTKHTTSTMPNPDPMNVGRSNPNTCTNGSSAS